MKHCMRLSEYRYKFIRLGADISKTRYPKGSAFGLSGASWPPDGFEIAGCQAFGASQSMGDGQVQMR